MRQIIAHDVTMLKLKSDMPNKGSLAAQGQNTHICCSIAVKIVVDLTQ